MVARFRMIAGPNGSGKSTLVALLSRDYAVNFYTRLNADDIFAEVKRSMVYSLPFPVEGKALREHVQATSYGDEVKKPFLDGGIFVHSDMVRFSGASCVNSYTIAMLTDFLQSEHLSRGLSFSQETVFSHPSKIEAIKRAQSLGYRTYLYFVYTTDPSINLTRISNRVSSGGHYVPDDKVVARFKRSFANARAALPFLSRAYFFDNSASKMRLVAEFSQDEGFVNGKSNLPEWFAL